MMNNVIQFFLGLRRIISQVLERLIAFARSASRFLLRTTSKRSRARIIKVQQATNSARILILMAMPIAGAKIAGKMMRP
jgi:hypothetical protein